MSIVLGKYVRGGRRMYCKKCGTKLEDGVKFCPKCGEHLIDDSVYENIKKRETKQKTKAATKTDNKKTVMMFVSVILVGALVGGGIFFIKNREDNVQGDKFSITENKKKETTKKKGKAIKEYECIRTDESVVLAAESGITMHKKYDKNGNVIYQLDGTGDNYSIEYKYTYFESGEVSSVNSVTRSYGEITSEFKATYKENGEMISGITTTYVDGVKTEKIHTEEYEYTYNSNGDVEKKKIITYIDGIKTNENLIYYNYDKNGEWRASERYRYSYIGKEIYLYYKAYDKWNEQKKEWSLEYVWEYLIDESEDYYEYNEQGDIIKSISTRFGIVDIYDYVYDENGNILNKTETTYFDVNDIHDIENLQDGSVTEWHYDYKYDEDGDIILKYAYEGEDKNPEDLRYYCTWTY